MRPGIATQGNPSDALTFGNGGFPKSVNVTPPDGRRTPNCHGAILHGFARRGDGARNFEATARRHDSSAPAGAV
jgi:hypothetical protein